MKKITNVIIIDASSSMNNKTVEIKDGIKSLLKDIRKDMKENKGKAKIRTIVTQFSYSNKFKVLLDTNKRKEILYESAEKYQPNGMTALYDAIGASFNMVSDDQDGVFVNILTDGEENDSKELTSDDVKKLFAKANERKWGITFMGTTQDAIESAVRLGIKASNTFKYVDSGVGTSIANVSRNASRAIYLNSVMTSNVQTDNLVDEKLKVND